MELKAGDGQYDLKPPDFAELAQMIRAPARAAGLYYEVDPQSGRKLDDALLEEAWRNPESLPLLEFTLDELYKARGGANVLTWATYHSLGGLEGAIARRAEAEFEELSAAGQEALPFIFGPLVTLERGHATAQQARLSDLTARDGAEEVVKRFIAANLFVASSAGDSDGKPVVALTHEALLRTWPRLRDWVAANREFLRVKTRIADAFARWLEANKDPDYLLHSGKPLAEAQDALIKRRSELDAQEILFIETSRDAEQARSRRLAARRNWFWIGGSANLAIVLTLIGGNIAIRHQLALVRTEKAAAIAASQAQVAASQAASFAQLGAEYWEKATHAQTATEANQNWLSALKAYQEAVKTDPKEPLYHIDVGTVLNRLGRFAEAAPELQKGVAGDSSFAWYYNELSKALKGIGNNAEAQEAARQAHKLDPRYPE